MLRVKDDCSEHGEIADKREGPVGLQVLLESAQQTYLRQKRLKCHTTATATTCAYLHTSSLSQDPQKIHWNDSFTSKLILLLQYC
jgi:hypothetical protein